MLVIINHDTYNQCNPNASNLKKKNDTLEKIKKKMTFGKTSLIYKSIID